MSEAEFPDLKAVADEIVGDPGRLTSVVEGFLGRLPFRARLGRQCAIAVILLERGNKLPGPSCSDISLQRRRCSRRSS